jgi:hypothetical protein
MVHIESEDDYEAINELRDIINVKYTGSTREPKLIKDKELVDKVIAAESANGELYRQICNRSLKIKHLSKVLKTGYHHLSKGKPGLAGQIIRFISLVALLPFFIAGFLLNYLTYIIPKLPLKKIRDIMFHDSVRWVLSIAVGLVLLIIYSFLAFVFIPMWWLAVIAILMVLPLGIIAWNYTLIWEKMVENMRIRKYIRRNRSEYKILIAEYNELVNDLSSI